MSGILRVQWVVVVAFMIGSAVGCGGTEDGPPRTLPVECGPDSCDADATCMDADGELTCECNEGFTGDGMTCADIDECADGNDDCDDNAMCTNTAGSFTCGCDEGFAGDGASCSNVDECAEGTDDCDDNATCTDTEGSFTCECDDGFSGDGVTCGNVDECAGGMDNCDDNATCTDTEGSFTCECNPSFVGDGTMCALTASCLELRTAGADADGIYAIDVDADGPTDPIIVYCDMITDGGGWTQLFDQDIANGYEARATWLAGVDIDMPNMGHYSILHLTSSFADPTGGFELRIDWPNEGADFVQWHQSEDPFVGRGTVSAVLSSPENQEGCTAFGGLAAEGHGSGLLDASTNGCWWWTIGTSAPWGGGIPAYDRGDDAARLVATRARLWVR